MPSHNRRTLFFLGFCSILILGAFGLSVTIPKHLSMNLSENSDVLNKQLDNGLKPTIDTTSTSASTTEWEHWYDYSNIISSFPISLPDNKLVVVGSQAEMVHNGFIVSFPTMEDFSFGTPDNDENVREVILDANQNLFIIGNRIPTESSDNASVFFLKMDSQTFDILYENEFLLETESYFRNIEVLPSGNYLILLSFYNEAQICRRLLELNQATGETIWYKDYIGISTDTSAIPDDNLKILQVTPSETIILVGLNETTGGAFISWGSNENGWTNHNFNPGSEIRGMVIDSSETMHAALEYTNAGTSQTDLEIVTLTQEDSLTSNYVFQASDKSYNVQFFLINTQSDSWEYPFLVYNIIDGTDHGIGYAFINGNSLSQNQVYNPGSSIQYWVSNPLFHENSVYISVSEGYPNSEYGQLRLASVGSNNWIEEPMTSSDYTNWIYGTHLTIGSDNKIWIQAMDVSTGAGIYSFDLNTGDQREYFSVGTDAALCKFILTSFEDQEYIIMYGIEGDFTQDLGEAVVSVYNTNGQEIDRYTFSAYTLYNENWEWANVVNGVLVLMGLQTKIDDYFHQTIIAASYPLSTIVIRGFKPANSISINYIQEFVQYEDLFSGTGTEEDPYILEWFEFNSYDDTTGKSSGIHLQNLGDSTYVVIRNCIIRNYQDTGILIRYSNHITIFNNTIERNGYSGIYLADLTYVNISYNVIDGNGYMGIFLNTEDFGSGCHHCTIDHNIITNTYQVDGDWDGNGINLELGTENSITYNNITGNAGYGIRIGNCWDKDDLYTVNNYIAFNNLCDNANGGVNFDNMKCADENTFEDNECGDPNDSGNIFDNIAGAPNLIVLFIGGITMMSILNRVNRKRKSK
ncbi:MAG: right-handed parallel beta-helix repeat-containing protein [Promethearchaeota archaeon]